jgi:hypothetical protein
MDATASSAAPLNLIGDHPPDPWGPETRSGPETDHGEPICHNAPP